MVLKTAFISEYCGASKADIYQPDPSIVKRGATFETLVFWCSGEWILESNQIGVIMQLAFADLSR